MRPDRTRYTGFIRRHCGSVAIEAPSGRAIGAQRQFPVVGPISRGWNLFPPVHPAGQASPSGARLIRVFNV